MKKIYYVSIFLIILIVSFLGITYSFEYGKDDSVKFELVGPSPLYINAGSAYSEYGIKVLYNDIDVSDKVKIDSSSVDITKLGEYKVRYTYGEEYIYRDVIVIDNSKPVISLIGGEEVYILLGGNYQESGYTVSDNADTDLESKVVVSGSVNTGTEGEYIIEYSVTDSSGNTGKAVRKVIVKKAHISVENNYVNRVSPTSWNITLYSNTVVRNNFYKYGIYYQGYVKDSARSYKIKLKNRDNKLEYSYNMNGNGNYYDGNLNLTTLENGTYDAYIIGNKEERLLNKLDAYNQIVRAKVGNKLATVLYDNDYVSISIEDFAYRYDFVIDPGHGGKEIGAENGIIAEKDLNLMISKYEKCRYESMGYKVYLTRHGDTESELLGGNEMDPLDRRALTIGYYGAVSRIVYSNHHNGSLNGDYGFEFLVPSQMSKDDLKVEMNLYKRFGDFYNLHDDVIRMYSKDYESGQIQNKSNGEIYGTRNYYSAIRIPYELFNVKMVIFEPIYMTNANDFNWYYSSGNWVTVSEMKIEEYVKSIGGKYNPDNKKCL